MHLTRRTLTLSAVALAACGPATQSPQQQPSASTTATTAPVDERPHSYAKLNQPAADFSLPRLGGGTASLSDYAGKALVVTFGGLWCPDCILDGPYVSHLAALAEADAHVDFLEIHTRNRFGRWGPNDRARAGATPYDATESAHALNAYFAETGHSYPVAFDASRNWAPEAYAIEWYPAYLIIDKSRIIRAWRNDLFNEEGANTFFAEAKRIAAA